MATAASLTVNFKDGTSHTMSHPVCQHNDIVHYNLLIKSLDYLQEQSNNVLTTLVNQERATHNRTCSLEDNNDASVTSSDNGELKRSSGNDGNEDDDDDEEEEEDENVDSTDKPPEKRRKI